MELNKIYIISDIFLGNMISYIGYNISNIQIQICNIIY